MTSCPCGSGRTLDDCCGPILAGERLAPTAEALMRARYTAFVTEQFGGFLTDSLAPEKRADVDMEEVRRSARDLEPVGLGVRATEGGGPDDDTGMVEYVAEFRVRGQVHSHHERATFRREDGRWLYVDGEMNPKQTPITVQKVGRNDPCPCGSGAKYKKCCGA